MLILGNWVKGVSDDRFVLVEGRVVDKRLRFIWSLMKFVFLCNILIVEKFLLKFDVV